MLPEPKQFVQFAISLTIFTAQEAGFYSNIELTNFWNPVFSRKSSYYTEYFGESCLYDVLAAAEELPIDFYSPPNRNRCNPNNVLRIGLRDLLLKIASLFASDWFVVPFVALFGFPCYFCHSLSNFSCYFSVSANCSHISTEFL